MPSSYILREEFPRSRIARVGRALQRHPRVVAHVQWGFVALYLSLLIAPLLPLPDQYAHAANRLRWLAQFLFWCVGWPIIILSMMIVGRAWCGLLCPDGTLTEFASRHGLKRSIPRWIRWSGWPLTMLLLTTIYGQLIGVYDFHAATFLLLGLPTLAALVCGLAYGNGKRIWCMYLCPANGVFALLARIAPLHFRVDEGKWKKHPAPLPRVDCPPLIDIRRMKTASACHACGRCAGYIDAVELAPRLPSEEILAADRKVASRQEVMLLIFGLLGICTMALHWAGSPLFALLKSSLSSLGLSWLEQYAAPWWLLANHPEKHTIYTLLDGLGMLLYIIVGGLLLGAVTLSALRLATAVAGDTMLSWQRLSMALIPAAGTGLFLGLSSLSLRFLPPGAVSTTVVASAQSMLLATGALFSLWLGARLARARSMARRLLALMVFSLPVALTSLLWAEKLFAR